jgi:hypothetical protein
MIDYEMNNLTKEIIDSDALKYNLFEAGAA